MLWWLVGVWLASGAVVPLLWVFGMVYRGVFVRDTAAEHAPTESLPTSLPAKWAFTWKFARLGQRPGGTWTAPKAARLGRYALSGLVGIGALILSFIGSFNEWLATPHDLPSAPAVAQSPVRPAAIAEPRPMQSVASAEVSPFPARLSAAPQEPALQKEAGQFVASQPPTGDIAEGAGEDAGRQASAAVTPPVPPAEALEAMQTASTAFKPPEAERGSVRRRARGTSVLPLVSPAGRGIWLFAPNLNAGGNS
jgi:hypothetical protein